MYYTGLGGPNRAVRMRAHCEAVVRELFSREHALQRHAEDF